MGVYSKGKKINVQISKFVFSLKDCLTSKKSGARIKKTCTGKMEKKIKLKKIVRKIFLRIKLISRSYQRMCIVTIHERKLKPEKNS